MNENILIVEDEIKIARFLELELNYEGYKAEKVHDGREALMKIKNNNYDLVLLDIMLPSLNGIEVLRRVRQFSDIPIIMLTAKDETMDKVAGLDMGANDYVTKPFEIEELLARIRALLKRNTQISNGKGKTENLNYGALHMDADMHIVTYNRDIIELTKKEFDLLHYLLLNKNRVLTREKILETVWGYDYLGDTNVVDVYIRYLRSKLDDRYNVKIIQTIRGVGYVVRDE
ncbi:response regulator transcription factor [Clostridium polynesiense]|uniref:response regulator transcription factor n=1 Tax=Clostridium polynesiense TaxID=1325933 RepID=UPI00058ECD04|nr:response regulator transcription factor [Clostridium polynesiense]